MNTPHTKISIFNTFCIVFLAMLTRVYAYTQSCTYSQSVQEAVPLPMYIMVSSYIVLPTVSVTVECSLMATLCCHFSPENAQLHLPFGSPIHTFFSAARDNIRRVVYSIPQSLYIPSFKETEGALWESLAQSTTLGQFLEQLSVPFSDTALQIRNLLLPSSY